VSKAIENFKQVEDILEENPAEDNEIIFNDILNDLLEDIQTNQELSMRLTKEIFYTFQHLLPIETFANSLTALLSKLNSTELNIGTEIINLINNYINQDLIFLMDEDTRPNPTNNYINEDPTPLNNYIHEDLMFFMDEEPNNSICLTPSTTSCSSNNSTTKPDTSNLPSSYISPHNNIDIYDEITKLRTNSDHLLFAGKMSGSYGSGIEKILGSISGTWPKNYFDDGDNIA